MRCKKHPTDTSGTVGVCASCLRESLFNLIAAQTQADLAQAEAQYGHHHHGQHHNSQPYFPRSVSPYVTTRKSDTSNNHHHHHHITIPFPRFFSTPQFGPTTTATAASDSAKKKKKGGGKFSVIKNLFRFSGNSKTTSSSKIRDPCTSSLPVTQDYGRPCRMMDRGMSPVRSSSHAESDILNGFLPKSPLQSGSRLPSHNRRGLFNRHVF